MKRIVQLIVVAAFLALLSVPGAVGDMLPTNLALAAPIPICPGGGPAPDGDPANCPGAGAATPVENCVAIALPITVGGTSCTTSDGKRGISNDPAHGGAVVVYLKQILVLLSGGVGLVIFLMLLISGIQYIISAGDPGSIKAAKNRIVNAFTALVLFLFTVGILQFLVPGGIL